jgi:hypothetical protein
MPLCIILIIVHKEVLTDAEKASLRQCYKVLGKYPIRLICPIGLNVKNYLKEVPNATFEFIDPKWQASYTMFGRLKIAPLLYKKHKQYQYILFYELDAWVFRDELEYWCKKGYDYIGAPWVEGWKNANPDAPIIGVGNGGFSLRKISSHLKALNSFAYVKKPSELLQEFKGNKNIKGLLSLLKKLTFRNNTFIWFNDYYLHEDIFWGMIVATRFKWFKVAPSDEAIKFSIEANPSRFITGPGTLPFGCHGWPKTDPVFWEKYINIKG